MKILLTVFVAMGLLMGSSVYASFESGGTVAQALKTAHESARVEVELKAGEREHIILACGFMENCCPGGCPEGSQCCHWPGSGCCPK